MAAVSTATPTTPSDVLHECQHNHSHNNDSKPAAYPFKFDKNSTLQDFLKSNKTQMDHLSKTNPEVMQISAHGQSPHTLWIETLPTLSLIKIWLLLLLYNLPLMF
ncbi:unnamed protein product [Ambrosiozyma monospora]|uniref:Unnamed protein product n=1 Tax=Ambrosiozyma monospora TaxID=43982 RepID=A0ACB5T6P1_AMBMO|nr:unnamed protein product [Ambrosiozyma monospora]